jgi:hypothetical protein
LTHPLSLSGAATCLNELLRFANGPTGAWFDGELWFFDNYIFPLTNKLKECGVFGVSSDECLK